jgi:hypothetical protein
MDRAMAGGVNEHRGVGSGVALCVDPQAYLVYAA